MSNVIKPEQLYSSKTATTGQIPVIDDSTALVIPGSLVFTSATVQLQLEDTGAPGILRLYPITADRPAHLTLKPNGTSVLSLVRLRNSSDDLNFGWVDFRLNGTNVQVVPNSIGTGNIPTTFQWNGNTIWHAGNSGTPGSGANADKVDGADASSNNVALTIPIRDASGIIYASIFNSSVATGTPPLTIASRTVVPNLNADLLDGADASQTPTKGQIPITNSSTGALQLVNGGASENSRLLLGRVGIGTYASYGMISTQGSAGANTGMVSEVNNNAGIGTAAMIINSQGTVQFPLAVTMSSTTAFSSTTPFSIAAGAAGSIITNLNADRLDGYHYTDLTNIFFRNYYTQGLFGNFASPNVYYPLAGEASTNALPWNYGGYATMNFGAGQTGGGGNVQYGSMDIGAYVPRGARYVQIRFDYCNYVLWTNADPSYWYQWRIHQNTMRLQDGAGAQQYTITPVTRNSTNGWNTVHWQANIDGDGGSRPAANSRGWVGGAYALFDISNLNRGYFPGVISEGTLLLQWDSSCGEPYAVYLGATVLYQYFYIYYAW